MTAVHSLSNFFELSDNSIREYQVTVIKYDGTSELVFVEAESPSEAQDLAASKVDDADYTFINCVY